MIYRNQMTMRRPALLVPVVAIAALLLARAPVRADNLLLDRFRDYLESLRTQAAIPGMAAALVGQQDMLWERAFGYQDLERSIAARTDTPFQVDGLTQVVTAAMALRCVEEGRLTLEDRVGLYRESSADANETLRDLFTNVSGAAGRRVFSYRPERLEPLAQAVRACAGDSYRETVANLLTRLAMRDSVPGADIIHVVPPAEGVPGPADVERYTSTLERLAVPYSVDASGRASTSRYVATTLTPGGGLISTVRDLARLDLALKSGVLVRAETLAAAWRAPLDQQGRPLPHGIGWFVQTYNGELIAWQIGVSENASSSLIVTVPGRGLTLILLANSDRLVKPFALTAGDLTSSPFGRLFLGLFVR